MYCLQIQAIHHMQTLQLIVVQHRITRTSQSLKQRSHLGFAYQIEIISKHFCRKWISVDFKKCVTLDGILDQHTTVFAVKSVGNMCHLILIDLITHTHAKQIVSQSIDLIEHCTQ